MQGAVVEFREKFIKPSKLDEAASIHWLWCVLIKTYFPTQSLARVYSVSAHIRISDAMMWLKTLHAAIIYRAQSDTS